MIDFIEDCGDPGRHGRLLYALPNTQLTRRLAKEGRLHLGSEFVQDDYSGDQCINGINFDTLRPLRDVLLDYKMVLERIYEPAAYAGRLDRLAGMLNREGRPRTVHVGDSQNSLAWLDTVNRVLNAVPEARDLFWKVFRKHARSNPEALRYIVKMMALYIHLSAFARKVIAAIDQRIETLDAGTPLVPAVKSAPQMSAAK